MICDMYMIILYNSVVNTQGILANRITTKGALVVSQETIGWTMLFLMLAANSTYSAFAKVLTGSLSPLSLVFLSEVLTALFLALSFGLLPIIRELRSLPRTKFIPLIFVGITSSLAAPFLLFYGLHRSPAVSAILFGNTEMLFLLVFATVLLGEKLHRVHYASAALIVVGLVSVALHGMSTSLTLRAGDIALIFSGIFFAIGDVIFRKYLIDLHVHTVVLGRSIVAILGCAIAVLFAPGFFVTEVRAFPMSLFPILIGFVLISRYINLFCFYEALEKLPVSVMSLTSNLSIVVSILFSSWFLSEAIHAYQIFGGLVIIAGALLIEVFEKHGRNDHRIAHWKQTKSHRV